MKRIKLLFTLIVTLFVLAGATGINIGCELLGLVPETESSDLQDNNKVSPGLEKKDEEYLESITESFLNSDISFNLDEQTYLSYFPQDTEKLRYLPEELWSSYKEVITKAIEVYPLGFVPQHLAKIYVVGNEIDTGGVHDSTAIAIDKVIFLTIDEKNSEALYLLVFHHIFNHVMQDTYKELFDSYYDEWILNNPEGFEYYDYEPKIDNEDRPEMYENGFISSYSMFHYSEDFAEIAGYAFSKDPVFLDCVMNYPRIRQKFELMVDFYSKIDLLISLEYFDEMYGQKL